MDVPTFVPLDPRHRVVPDWDRMTPAEQGQHYFEIKRYYVGDAWPDDPTVDVPVDHPQRAEIDEVLLLNTPPNFRERMSSP